MVQDHKFIVFCGDGVNALGLVRSLGEKGIKTNLISLTNTEHLVNASKYIADIDIVYNGEEGLKVLLRKYGNEKNKPFVLFTDDLHTALFDEYYDELIDKFYFENAGKKGALQVLQNKEYQCQLANQCGIRIPINEIVKKGELPTKVPYPILTKTLTSNLGAWKKDMFICQNEEELKNAYKQIKAGDLIIEEYIKKKNERDLKGFSINCGEDVYLSYIKSYYRFDDKAFGHYMYYEQCKDEQLKERVKKMIRKAHYTGLFDVEFLVAPNDELVFLEVNWRSGMSNYAHTVGGVNLPYLWAESMLKGEIDNESILQTKTFMTAMNEIADFGQSVLQRKISVFKWLRDLTTADSLYYWNKHDLKPLFVGWKAFLSRKISNFKTKHKK